MTVVDSSVWTANLRKLDIASVRTLHELALGVRELLLADIVLLEVLQGARDDRHAQRLERDMRQFPLVQVLDAGLGVAAARNARALRSRGVTIRKTVDLILGTFCIERVFALLQNDQDFLPMAAHLGLRLA